MQIPAVLAAVAKSPGVAKIDTSAATTAASLFTRKGVDHDGHPSGLAAVVALIQLADMALPEAP